MLAPPAGRDGGRVVHAVVEGGGGADVQAAWEYRRRNPGALVAIKYTIDMMILML
jgi:hypothetical protein